MKKNRRIMEKAVTTSPKAGQDLGKCVDQKRPHEPFCSRDFHLISRACQALQYVPHELQKEALEVVKSSPEVRRNVTCAIWRWQGFCIVIPLWGLYGDNGKSMATTIIGLYDSG